MRLLFSLAALLALYTAYDAAAGPRGEDRIDARAHDVATDVLEDSGVKGRVDDHEERIDQLERKLEYR